MFPCPVFPRGAVLFFMEASAEITLTVITCAAGNFANGKVRFLKWPSDAYKCAEIRINRAKILDKSMKSRYKYV